MNAKRKAVAPKENGQAVRKLYTWHLRQPFKTKFDCSQWWKGQKEIESAAALYELARRHPLVRETWLKNLAAANHGRRGMDKLYLPKLSWTEKVIQHQPDHTLPHSLYWTCLFGLKSWTQLEYSERRHWVSNAGCLKGLDLRCETSQCQSITERANWKIIDDRKDALRKKGLTKDTTHIKANDEWEAANDKNLSALHNDMAVNPPTAEEWEAAIAYRAVEAYRQGYLLLAVVPDLESDKAASLMQKVLGATKRRFASPKQRARWDNWLPLIAKFENEELQRGEKFKKSQAFIQYRRVLDGILFA